MKPKFNSSRSKEIGNPHKQLDSQVSKTKMRKAFTKVSEDVAIDNQASKSSIVSSVGQIGQLEDQQELDRVMYHQKHGEYIQKVDQYNKDANRFNQSVAPKLRLLKSYQDIVSGYGDDTGYNTSNPPPLDQPIPRYTTPTGNPNEPYTF